MSEKANHKKRAHTISILFIGAFFLSFILLYLHNITRDIYSGDIGDLVTAAYVFGIPHPPGYPLLTFLGFLLSRFPLPLPVVSKVAIISVVASIIGLVFYFKYSLQSTKNLLITVYATSVLGLSYYYWFFSEIPEVFALSNALLILIFYFAIHFYRTKKIKNLYFAAFFSGLSLANQHAIIATFPAVLLLTVPHIKLLFKQKKRFLFVIVAFLLGLIPYVYVPISASLHPVINWSNEPTLANFIALVLRSRYEIAPLVTPIVQKIAVVSVYFSTLITNYSYLIAGLCLIGFYMLLRKERLLAVSLLIGFFLSGPLFIFMIVPRLLELDDLGVLERFYMHSFILFLFFLPIGLMAIQKLLERVLPRKIYATFILLPLFIVPATMLYYNFPKTDLSKVTIGGNLALDILSSVPKNAMIYLSSDSSIFNSWYYTYVLDFRSDVTILAPAGAMHPYEKEIKKLTEARRKLGASATISNESLERAKRPLFSSYPYPITAKNHIFIPRGILSEFIKREDIPEKNEFLLQIQRNTKKLHIPKRESLLPSEQNLITPNITKSYSIAFVTIADFLLFHYKSTSDAIRYYKEATKIDYNNSVAFARLGIAQSFVPHMCKEAQKNSERAINLYPLYAPFYQMLYAVYENCHVRNEMKDALRMLYKQKFHEDIEVSVKPSY